MKKVLIICLFCLVQSAFLHGQDCKNRYYYKYCGFDWWLHGFELKYYLEKQNDSSRYVQYEYVCPLISMDNEGSGYCEEKGLWWKYEKEENKIWLIYRDSGKQVKNLQYLLDKNDSTLSCTELSLFQGSKASENKVITKFLGDSFTIFKNVRINCYVFMQTHSQLSANTDNSERVRFIFISKKDLIPVHIITLSKLSYRLKSDLQLDSDL